jgi:hypothetical protein
MGDIARILSTKKVTRGDSTSAKDSKASFHTGVDDRGTESSVTSGDRVAVSTAQP